jgi:ribosomal protein L10
VSVEAYETQLREQLAELENATYEFSDERQQILQKTFSLITGNSSVLQLQQTLTSLDSANKSLLEINEALNEGTLSFEQLTQLATILNDETDIFYKTLREEGMEGIRSLITTSLVGPYDQYLKQIDDFILGQQAIIESNDADSAATKAAQQNIDLVNEYRKSYMTFNKESFEAYMLKKKIAVLEKDINEGNINSYKELISIKEKEKQEAQDRLNQYFKTYPQEMELIKKIRSGTISLADAWASVGDKENFKRLVENSES